MAAAGHHRRQQPVQHQTFVKTVVNYDSMFSELPNHPALSVVAVEQQQQQRQVGGVAVAHVVDVAGLEDRSYVAAARGPVVKTQAKVGGDLDCVSFVSQKMGGHTYVPEDRRKSKK